jgi:hypothetical protein
MLMYAPTTKNGWQPTRAPVITFEDYGGADIVISTTRQLLEQLKAEVEPNQGDHGQPKVPSAQGWQEAPDGNFKKGSCSWLFCHPISPKSCSKFQSNDRLSHRLSGFLLMLLHFV